jgi:hypothetical protein
MSKTVKPRNPIAFDLLVSGTYKQRKVKNKCQYTRNFKNRKSFERQHSF